MENFDSQNKIRWTRIDHDQTAAEPYRDGSGFWRLPFTTEAERAASFMSDKDELKRLGALKSENPSWPNEGVVHFYQPSALILGKLDRRLPAYEEAIDWLEEEQVPTVLRIAGGQAIVSDRQVLNVSLLFPEPSTHLSICQGFHLIADLIREAWRDCLRGLDDSVQQSRQYEMQVGEIARSYCPGDFDLSIGGLKVAGIAQRRVRGAIGLMAYISMGGDQAARCRLVSDFYRAGDAGSRFPASDGTVMTTLSDVVGIPLQVDAMKDSIMAVLGRNRQESGNIAHGIILRR